MYHVVAVIVCYGFGFSILLYYPWIQVGLKASFILLFVLIMQSELSIYIVYGFAFCGDVTGSKYHLINKGSVAKGVSTKLPRPSRFASY